MHRAVRILLLLVLSTAAAQGAQGRRGVVATEHRLASEVGVAILQRGGNAVDAALAAALTVGVVNPSSCGLGGGGFMLIFEKRSGSVTALDYRERAPAAASRDMFVIDGRARPELSRYGGLAVGVPGEVAGILAAHRRYGSLPLAELARPAIAHARDGFEIENHLAEAIGDNVDRIRREPALAARFLREDGSALRAGEGLVQPDLAATLETIVREGERGFYEGEVAEAVVRTVRAHGGILGAADLSAYRPVWREPVRGVFLGHEIFSMPPPSSGGGVLVQVLEILTRDDLQALQHNSPTYIHLLAEAMQFAFADRAAYYGDPDFVNVPLAMLLAPSRTVQLRNRISSATTYSPKFYGEGASNSGHGTSHLSVIDGNGNAVALTTSINTAFGSMLVADGTGIILNSTMDDFSAQPGAPNVYGLIGNEANAVAPRKRPLSSMTPSIVLKDGSVVAAAGASGGPLIISGTLQVLLNTVVFGLDADSAVGSARVHHQWLPPVLAHEPAIGELTRRALKRLGHSLHEIEGIGAVQLARRHSDGLLEGASDPRKGGKAAAW